MRIAFCLQVFLIFYDFSPCFQRKHWQIDVLQYLCCGHKKVSESGRKAIVIDNVLKWRDECFELVYVKATNADRIRNMSDEELAELITGSLNFDCADYCDSFTQGCAFNCNKKEREIALKWLQSEAE